MEFRGSNRQDDSAVLYLTVSVCPGGSGKKSMGLKRGSEGVDHLSPTGVSLQSMTLTLVQVLGTIDQEEM